jgi:hypothetical protein
MKQYRKKPVVIDAIQLTEDNFKDYLDIALSDSQTSDVGFDEVGIYLLISTLEGDMKARLNDWIIRGVNGELYPCKPDIFEKTYEIFNN